MVPALSLTVIDSISGHKSATASSPTEGFVAVANDDEDDEDDDDDDDAVDGAVTGASFDTSPGPGVIERSFSGAEDDADKGVDDLAGFFFLGFDIVTDFGSAKTHFIE